MYELIKIENTTIGSEAVPTVSARELHKFLESKQDYSTWIKKRIEKYEFVENQDYIRFHKKMEANNATMVEYYVTLDMAKELSMVENNDKGRQARRYFIECEKQLKEVLPSKEKLIATAVLSTTVEERVAALGAYQRLIVEPLIEFKEQALPKVSYYDNVLMSPGLVTITQIAKDYGMTAVDFNKLLESLHIQYKQSGQWLYHHYAKSGYTQSSTYITEYGYSKLTTKWTQKGRLFIYKVLKDKGILPYVNENNLSEGPFGVITFRSVRLECSSGAFLP